jgi:hypothetical protein
MCVLQYLITQSSCFFFYIFYLYVFSYNAAVSTCHSSAIVPLTTNVTYSVFRLFFFFLFSLSLSFFSPENKLLCELSSSAASGGAARRTPAHYTHGRILRSVV